MDSVPQYSDILIKFEDIEYNLSPTTVDLSAVDDIILSVSKGSIGTPTLILQQTTSPSKFSVDNTNKTVTVTLTDTEVGAETGKYFVNLWLVVSGRYVTHLTNSFEVVQSVKYSAS